MIIFESENSFWYNFNLFKQPIPLIYIFVTLFYYNTVKKSMSGLLSVVRENLFKLSCTNIKDVISGEYAVRVRRKSSSDRLMIIVITVILLRLVSTSSLHQYFAPKIMTNNELPLTLQRRTMRLVQF